MAPLLTTPRYIRVDADASSPLEVQELLTTQKVLGEEGDLEVISLAVSMLPNNQPNLRLKSYLSASMIIILFFLLVLVPSPMIEEFRRKRAQEQRKPEKHKLT